MRSTPWSTPRVTAAQRHFIAAAITAAIVLTSTACSSPDAAPSPAASPGASGAASAAATATATTRSLDDPELKDVAMQLVSTAENSSLDWRGQFGYIEDIGDGRGYTAGIIGFCSGTGDMLELVEAYTAEHPGNPLASYLPALRSVNGSDSHDGLDSVVDGGFVAAWHQAANDAAFTAAQEAERDRVYFDPAVAQAKADGLQALGQFAYYDAIVMHGPGTGAVSFGGIRTTAMEAAKTPHQGGDESTYLQAFLEARADAMRTEEAHSDTSRVDTAQRVFLAEGNLALALPLHWAVYGDEFSITEFAALD